MEKFEATYFVYRCTRRPPLNSNIFLHFSASENWERVRERDSVVFQLQNLLHRISWALSVSLRAVACRNAMPLSSLHRRSSAAPAFRRPCYAKLRCLASDWMHLCVFCTHWAFLSFNQNGLEKPKETVFYLICLPHRNHFTEKNFPFWVLSSDLKSLLSTA